MYAASEKVEKEMSDVKISDADFLELYEQYGKDCQKIAELTGYTRGHVQNRLRGLGVKWERPSRRGQIEQLLNEGKTDTEIMQLMNVSKGYVQNVRIRQRLYAAEPDYYIQRVQSVVRRVPRIYPVVIRGRKMLDVTEEWEESISLEYRDVMVYRTCV